jgi:hypothetical protein
MSKHVRTPGPWGVVGANKAAWDDCSLIAIVGPDNALVCNFGDSTTYYPSEGVEPNKADLALIVASPDLLLACRFARDSIASMSGLDVALAMCEKAVTTAEGR